MVVQILAEDQAQATLAALLCVQQLRELAAPLLYHTLHIRNRTIAKLLVGLPSASAQERRRLIKRPARKPGAHMDWPDCPCPSEDEGEADEASEPPAHGGSVCEDPCQADATKSKDRLSGPKRALFQLTRDLVIVDVPPARFCADLLHACSHLERDSLLFPHVYCLQLGVGIYDRFSDWRDRNGGARHPLVRALEIMLAPGEICIDHTKTIGGDMFHESRMEQASRSGVPFWLGSCPSVVDLYLDRKWSTFVNSRKDHILDDLPRWPGLGHATHHNLDSSELGHYPATRIYLFFGTTDYESSGVTTTIRTMLGRRPPMLPIDEWLDAPDYPGLVADLYASFTVPKDTMSPSNPSVAWHEQVVALVVEETEEEEGHDELDASEQERLSEEIWLDMCRRVLVQRTDETEACLCCGKK